jgi:hypothetical protein
MDTGLIVVICIFSVAGVCGFLVFLGDREAKKNKELAEKMMNHVFAEDNTQKSNTVHDSYPQQNGQQPPNHGWFYHNPPQHPAQQQPYHGWFGHHPQVPAQHPAQQQPHPAQQGGWFHGWHYVQHAAVPQVPTGVPVNDLTHTWGKA